MRKVIEYPLLSADGVFEDPARLGFMQYRDGAYLRDGLGFLSACDAMLMGRNTYESLANIWPSRSDPWACRLNAMKKYMFSSTLKEVTWSNAALVRGDAAAEAADRRAGLVDPSDRYRPRQGKRFGNECLDDCI
jgi:dihydrofolate reductase